MSILRSTAAGLAGYVVFAASAGLLFQLSGRDPHAAQSTPFMLLTTAYGMLFAALGGMLAMRIARVRPSAHAVGVAALIALGATISLIASPGAGATWTQWGAILLMAPSALLGLTVMRRRGG